MKPITAVISLYSRVSVLTDSILTDSMVYSQVVHSIFLSVKNATPKGAIYPSVIRSI